MPRKVKSPLTPAQRQARLKTKLAKFGVKKVGVKLSESEREMIARAVPLSGCSSREEFIVEALHLRCKSLGLSLSDINQELQERKEQQ